MFFPFVIPPLAIFAIVVSMALSGIVPWWAALLWEIAGCIMIIPVWSFKEGPIRDKKALLLTLACGMILGGALLPFAVIATYFLVSEKMHDLRHN